MSVPLYDLDEIIATLTLDEIPLCTRRTKPPPPPYSILPRTPSPAISCPAPAVPVPAVPVPAVPAPHPQVPASRVSPAPHYVYRSPVQAGSSQDWSEAGHATQGTPHAHVRRLGLRLKSRSRTGKFKVYVVFRGRFIGVFDLWDDVVAATSGFRFALQQGYSSRQDAELAYQFAETHGWTSNSQTWTPTPLLSKDAPLPHPVPGKTASSPSTLSYRETGAPWYIAYRGINPGVFGTFVECALNTLGVDKHEVGGWTTRSTVELWLTFWNFLVPNSNWDFCFKFSNSKSGLKVPSLCQFIRDDGPWDVLPILICMWLPSLFSFLTVAMSPARVLTRDELEDRKIMAGIYCDRYYRKNREHRNAQTRERMARLRAQDDSLPPHILEARLLARREDARKYREKSVPLFLFELISPQCYAENRRKLAHKARELRTTTRGVKQRERVQSVTNCPTREEMARLTDIHRELELA
ncbi:hypothetical protein C8R46DRAFT_1030589 [Mycena filopes]|nr:hypothetical protein C8R46DRAFT_1030589 [Mycena filopes]